MTNRIGTFIQVAFVCVCVAFPYFETQTGNLLRHNVSKKDFHAQERDISMNGIGVINF